MQHPQQLIHFYTQDYMLLLHPWGGAASKPGLNVPLAFNEHPPF